MAGELLNHLAPLMSFLHDKVQDHEILLDGPLAPLDGLIEVIEPVLPALLGSFEVVPSSLKEYES